MISLVVISALIDSTNPCAYSVLLLTVAFLVGISASRRKIISVGAVYILGIFLAYFAIGLGLLQALELWGVSHRLGRVGAILAILFGLTALIGHYFPKFPIKLKIPDFTHGKMAVLMSKATMPAAFALGALVGLFEFPCTGGPYLLIIGLLHDQATRLSGLAYLALFNLVFVAPLIIVLLAASGKTFTAALAQWRERHGGALRVATAIIMVGLGLFVFFIN
ncbi:hypothetical protein KGQ31_02375 [Patescibacteria group bacterium]|nr:hypothetical protein [Patescibacteria group bacterium]